MPEKDLTAKPVRKTPTLEDAASQFAATQFGPEALERAEREAAEAEAADTARREAEVALQRQKDSSASSNGAEDDDKKDAPIRSVVSPAAIAQSTLTGSLTKKTIYPSEAGRRFLRRFRRRPTAKIAETLVAEFALEQLFAKESNEAITQPLRARGHGLRRARTDLERRRPLTIYLSEAMRARLETFPDQYELAEGIVGGHAVDWLAAHMTEDEIVAALLERGYGLYRSPRASGGHGEPEHTASAIESLPENSR